MKRMKKKVLVIEQNHSLGFVLKTVLNESFDTLVVSNPFDAMDAISQHEIACIVLGIDKRNGESHSFLQHLKSSSLLKNIPLVALTDMDAKVFKEIYGENDPLCIFPKPFDPLKVKETVTGLASTVDTTQIIFRKRKILNLN